MLDLLNYIYIYIDEELASLYARRSLYPLHIDSSIISACEFLLIFPVFHIPLK